MRQLHHHDVTAEQPWRLEQAEIQVIASRLPDPFSAETLVRGRLGLAVLRGVAVVRTLADRTISRAVERIREGMGAVGWTSGDLGCEGLEQPYRARRG